MLQESGSPMSLSFSFRPIKNRKQEQERTMDVKQELARKAGRSSAEGKNGTTEQKGEKKDVTLTKNMSIADLIRAMEPEIKKALPGVVTPERFTRMALSALNTTPKLRECTQMSFLAALMNAAQLGLEPNTSLGQAYLIPYKNKGVLECQFQIGYKGMIDLVYRNEMVQTIQAHCVYQNDEFDYELGLEPKLYHRPALKDRGELFAVYAMFRLQNGGCGFEVMSKADIDAYAGRYAQSIDSAYSPWESNYEEMAKKTVIKRVLKYAPLKTEFVRAMHVDNAIQKEISVDMSEIQNQQEIIDSDCQEIEA